MKDIKLLEKAWTEYVDSGAKVSEEEINTIKTKLSAQLALDYLAFAIGDLDTDKLILTYFLRGIEVGKRYQEMMELKEVLED